MVFFIIDLKCFEECGLFIFVDRSLIHDIGCCGGIKTDHAEVFLYDGQTERVNGRYVCTVQKDHLFPDPFCLLRVIDSLKPFLQGFGCTVFHFHSRGCSEGNCQHFIHADTVFQAAFDQTLDKNTCLAGTGRS